VFIGGRLRPMPKAASLAAGCRSPIPVPGAKLPSRAGLDCKYAANQGLAAGKLPFPTAEERLGAPQQGQFAVH
jgi:hypothetical protein